MSVSTMPNLLMNPVANLLPPDRQSKLATLSANDRHVFYGRVLESVLSHPGYQQVVFDAATREFDQMTGATQRADLGSMVEDAVARTLAARGIH